MAKAYRQCMNDKKWEFCSNLAAKISSAVMLDGELVEDEGALKTKVRKILQAMGLAVIRAVAQNRKYALTAYYVYRGQTRIHRFEDKDLFNKRTLNADVDAFEFKSGPDGTIERKDGSLLQAELKIGSCQPHNNRWPTAKKGYLKDLRRVAKGEVDAFVGAVDETFYRSMTGDDIRASKNRRRGNNEKMSLKNLFPPMEELIRDSMSTNPTIFYGKWEDPDTKQVHSLKSACYATKYIGLQSPPQYNTTIAQAPPHDFDSGKHKCGACSKYDGIGLGRGKSQISKHWKKEHPSNIHSYAEHKVVFVIGIPEEGRAF